MAEARSAENAPLWRRYLAESVSLFLAVSLGFVVDNYREAREDRQRERVLMQQVVLDLRSDLEAMDSNVVARTRRGALLDSLLDLSEPGALPARTGDLYYFSQAIRSRWYFEPTDGAFEQLFGGGGLQYVEAMPVLAAIQRYRRDIVALVGVQTMEEEELGAYRHGPMTAVADARVVRAIRHLRAVRLEERTRRPEGNPPLLSRDPMALNALFQAASSMMNMNSTSIRLLDGLRQRNRALEQLILRTYDLPPLSQGSD